MPPPPPVASPCRKQCQLHPIEKLCLGCFRTIDEIGRWTRYSDARRQAIIAELPARRQAREDREAARAARREAASGGGAVG